MSITPRQDEIRTVVALMEGVSEDEVDMKGAPAEAVALARDIIKTLGDRFLERSWYVNAVRVDGLTLLYGLGATEKAAETAGPTDWPRQVMQVYSAATWTARQVPDSDGKDVACSNCRHPKHLHDWPSKGVAKNRPGKGCIHGHYDVKKKVYIRTCDCPSYES